MIKYLWCLLFIVFLVSLPLAGYYLNRWWNWKFYYEESVKHQIIIMVKPECLR